jgi:hypothetical protein
MTRKDMTMTTYRLTRLANQLIHILGVVSLLCTPALTASAKEVDFSFLDQVVTAVWC